MVNEEYDYHTPVKEDINFREILDGYLRYWRWFAIGAAVALIGALLYLRFTAPIYYAATTIIIKDEKGKSGPSDESTFADIGMLEGLSTSSIENELGLLRSMRLMTNSVKALNLNIQYFAQDGFPRREVYKGSPFKIRLMRMDEAELARAMARGRNEFSINWLADDKLEIEFESGDDSLVKLGSVIEFDFADFVIEVNETFGPLSDEDNGKIGVDVRFLPIASVASYYGSNLGVELVDENSTLIQVSMLDNVKSKARDILDQLIFEYNQEAIEDKNLIARNTAFFIDERLSIINSELDSVETGKEQFKEANRLTDIQAESSMIIQNVSEYNNKQQEVNTQLELTKAMIEHLNSNTSKLLPTNMGIDESGTNQLIDEFNSLVLERDRLLKGATERNPLVVSLDNQIQQIRSNVMASLRQRQSNLRIARDNLQRQAGILGSQISEVPGQERRYRGIERQQNIKEALYLFLLQKREETSLSLAAKAPKAKLVDQAYSLGTPVSPNSKIVLAVALLSGLFIPFLIINVKNLLNNKVRSKEDIMKMARTIPFLGEVPHIDENDKSVIDKDQRSVLAEAFSILCANLQYLEKDDRSAQMGICMYVTSSIQEEGKTFSVLNLGITFARAGKKVLVMGADLRNPQLHRHEGTGTNSNGLSNYLANDGQNVTGYIKSSKLHSNLKIMHSGTVPPNPTELLRKKKIGNMFEELKVIFDYVIVDTAPAMLLADTFLISRYADLTLYLVRSGHTKKNLLEFAVEANREGKLKNMGFVLNDVPMADASYGNRYGYGYGETDVDFWTKNWQFAKVKGREFLNFISRLRTKNE
jgi:capsular exopolysaccharide synthesis family protein